MINVFYGGADRDADRFMFGRIRRRLPERTMLVVPDQFTLQAERNALEHLNTDTLMNLEVIGRSHFESGIMGRIGKPPGVMVNYAGRYMLLTDIVNGKDTKEDVFADVKKRGSFTELLAEIISEFKQYNINSESLSDIADNIEDEVLQKKLNYLSEICADYEKTVSDGRFIDSEDCLRYIADNIGGYSDISECEIWFEGFYDMTPVMEDFVKALAEYAVNVNILITDDGSGDDVFRVSSRLRRSLRGSAESSGIPYYEELIPDSFAVSLSPEPAVIRAGDFYSEAETVAVRVTELVREKGFRYSDIAIICNDMEYRGSVFKRVFETYGIPLFMDEKRSITQEPEVEFIFSMFDCIKKNRSYDDVFRMLKTGYSPISDDECEKLENYCRKYNIKGGRWKKDFKYGTGSGELTDEELSDINRSREKADSFITRAESLFSGKRTVRERTEALYVFMTEEAHMRERISAAYDMLIGSGELESAGSTAQIWDSFVNVLEQVVEVLGDREADDEAYEDILRAGFSGVEIGLIPTANDQVILGTVSRTMTGRVKALFIAGANEGVLPAAEQSSGILSDDEKQIMADMGYRTGSTREFDAARADISLYMNINKAEDYLTVSYSVLDSSGDEIRPSSLVYDIQEKYNILPEKDVISSNDPLRLIQTEKGAMNHLIAGFRAYIDGKTDGEPSDEWKAMAMASSDDEGFMIAEKGLFFDNKLDAIEEEYVNKLYGRGGSGVFALSASKIERYSRCPFAFFIQYGLKPEEERIFAADGRSIGDVYHECMRRISEELSGSGEEITSPDSGWMKIDKETCESRIADIVDEITADYREGLFKNPGRDSYVASRLRKACFGSVWAMITQVRMGSIKKIYFEEEFSHHAGAAFPPVKIDLENGGTVFAEGKIDRIDIIKGGEGDGSNYVRVVDYKSGTEKFSMEEVESGYRMQLMTYLKGAMGGIDEPRPAGVFYFPIKEKKIDSSYDSELPSEEDAENSILKSSAMDGIMLDDETVLHNMGRVKGRSAEKPGVMTIHKSRLLSGEEFDGLISVNDGNMKQAAEGFAGGVIDINPKKGRDQTACDFCGYRTICGRRAAVNYDEAETGEE